MNAFLIVIFVVIVVAIILGILYIYNYNRINDTIIRVNEAESRIDSNLRDKYDTINRCVTIIKNKIKLDEKTFKGLAVLKTRKLSSFELDRSLVSIHDELIGIYENNKELKDNDELYKAIKQLEIINDELITLRKYYNGNISLYNKMIKRIPTSLIAKIKKYKEKTYYDLKDMTDEDIEDFKL